MLPPTASISFALLFCAVAVAGFWGSEWIEKRVAGAGPYLGSPFLKAFSVTILVGALAVALLPPALPSATLAAPAAPSETGMLQAMEAGEDHIDPDELADRLMTGDGSLLLVDIRTPTEFEAFHIRGAVNVAAAPDILQGATNATVYYLPGSTGWGVTFGGPPTEVWRPEVPTGDADFGVRTNQFQFTVSYATGMRVVLETSTDLANPTYHHFPPITTVQ